MRNELTVSIVLHASIAGLLVFGLPLGQRKLPEFGPALGVDVVSHAEVSEFLKGEITTDVADFATELPEPPEPGPGLSEPPPEPPPLEPPPPLPEPLLVGVGKSAGAPQSR